MASSSRALQGQECRSQYLGKKTNPVYRHLAPVWPYPRQEGQLDICLEQIRRSQTSCLGTQAEALATQDSQFLIIPLLLRKSIQVSLCLAFPGLHSQFPLEGVLALHALIWCPDTLPLSPVLSVTGCCFKAGCSRHSQAPGPESIPWLAHPQGSSSYLYPLPK